MVEKKTINVHAFTVHIYSIAVLLLVALLIVIGLKYAHLKMAVKGYTASTIWMNSQDKPDGHVSDYAAIISATAADFVPSADLSDYVAALSKKLNRDIVIVDRNKKILADTIADNRGDTYTADRGNEIRMTIADGMTREFEERSADYPNGIVVVVIPMKNQEGSVIGAVLVSTSQLK